LQLPTAVRRDIYRILGRVEHRSAGIGKSEAHENQRSRRPEAMKATAQTGPVKVRQSLLIPVLGWG
jgi:hypothetical protein